MRLRFWGARGSVPTSRADTRRYGGNTPCVEVRAGQQLFILDAGSGIRDLGEDALAWSSHITATLLLSHYHWDHIQGLPFFTPIYLADSTLAIFGPRPQGGLSLEGILLALFRPPFFPVATDQLKSNFRLEEVDGKARFSVGDTTIRTCRLNHPQGGLAYRLEQGGASLVYASDHEPGDPVCDRALRQLAEGADLLIGDAQYEPGQLTEKTGWGHGSWETSVALAREAGAKSLVLFHHEPSRSDLEVDEIATQARRIFSRTWAASEDLCLEINREKIRVQRSGSTEEHSFTESPIDSRIPRSELTIDLWSGATSRAGNGSVRNESLGAEEQREMVSGREEVSGRNEAYVEPQTLAEPQAPVTGVAVLDSSFAHRGADDHSDVTPARRPAQPRRYPRISLVGAESYGRLKDDSGSQSIQALDLSFGGISFLMEEKPQLPETFEVHLQVPVLPETDYRVRQVYVKPTATGKWRLGCSFSP